MGRTWKPEQIMSDFEASLMPAVAAEVKPIHYFIRHICVFRFSFLEVLIEDVIFTLINAYIDVFNH